MCFIYEQGKLGFVKKKSSVRSVAKPSLLLHGVGKVDDESINRVVAAHNGQRVQRTYRSADVYGDVAVVYFDSKKDAYSCLGELKSARIGGQKIGATYKDLVEPAVEISIPSDVDETVLRSHLTSFRIVRVVIQEAPVAGKKRTAVVVVSTPKEAQTLCDRVNMSKVGAFNLALLLFLPSPQPS